MTQLLARATLLLVCILVPSFVLAQNASEKLSSAFKAFLEDPQLRNGMASLYVINAITGHVVYEHNGMVGLIPASTMKVITSISAYELLGEGFRYKTAFAYHKKGEETTLVILPSGDPTFGSWRWKSTAEDAVLKGLTQAIQRENVHSFRSILLDQEGWNEETIPDGWIWQDIGNYYGAGAAKLNWRENQFDVILRSGKNIGDPVSIVTTIPPLKEYALRSEVKSAAAGTGDQAYIYFPLNAASATIRGTIPINQNSFKISGAMPAASDHFAFTLRDALLKTGITVPVAAPAKDKIPISPKNYQVFYSVVSPPLDSLIFWFNRKSINLYGEALVKTIAFAKRGVGSTDTGVELIREYWEKKGIPQTELNMVDGSGLSPLNRVTTHAQVSILQHAQKQSWFSGFYRSLPEFNGMKMKSGTTRGAKGFCGYHKAKDGNEYVFSFLVNNYNGSSAALVQKMYKVLDGLK
jgi:D-alanyl-D-alanine carboxypeptidase/D-alanyl-D-alanine-endopeptidase (penicillin-binding protein 4)